MTSSSSRSVADSSRSSPPPELDSILDSSKSRWLPFEQWCPALNLFPTEERPDWRTEVMKQLETNEGKLSRVELQRYYMMHGILYYNAPEGMIAL